MDILKHYLRLAEYDAWANREVLRSLREAGKAAPARALALMAHVVAAQNIWVERVKNPGAKPPVWPEWSLDEVEQKMPVVMEGWRAILSDGDAGLRRSIEYQNSKGEKWANNVGDIFQHVMMHGMYHRGQIATLLRQAGANPAYTDYIDAVRKGLI